MNIHLLKDKIMAKEMSVFQFCNEVKIKKTSFYRKLNGGTEFCRDEIERIATVLELTSAELMQIFFEKLKI